MCLYYKKIETSAEVSKSYAVYTFVLQLIHRFDCLEESLHRSGGLRGMEQAEGNGIVPVHWDGLEQRVNVLPVVNGHENVIGVLALIEDVDA